jgi:hypothetical protein
MDAFSLSQNGEGTSQPQLTADEQGDLQLNLQAVGSNIGDFLNYINEFITHYNNTVPAARYQVAEFLDDNLLIPLHTLRVDLPETERQKGVRLGNRLSYLRSLPEKGGRTKKKKQSKKTRSSFHN